MRTIRGNNPAVVVGRALAVACMCSCAASTGALAFLNQSLLSASATGPPPPPPTYPLKVSGGQLQTASGSPHLVIGESGYVMMAEVPVSNYAAYFLRLQQYGFNASIEETIWPYNNNGLAYDGTAPFTATLGGCTPLGPGNIGCYDLSTPNSTYWNEVLTMVRTAASYGVLVELGTADSGGCATVQNMFLNLQNAGPTAAYNFGVFLGNTFKNEPNIIWYFGVDYYCWQDAPSDNLLYQLALGIQSTGDQHLYTFEVAYPVSGSSAPGGAEQTSLDDTTHNWASIIGVNWVYNGFDTWVLSQHAYQQAPSVPAILGELNYAGRDTDFFNNSIPNCSSSAIPNSPYCPPRQRQEEWWAATIGAYWGANVGHPATLPEPTVDPSIIPIIPDTEFVYLTTFLQRLPWYKLQPSPGGTGSIVTAGFGTTATDSSGSGTWSNYVTSSLSADGSLALIYLPPTNPGPITVDMSKMTGSVTARWYDPTSDPTLAGSYTVVCSPTTTPCSSGSVSFTSPFTHSLDSTTDAVLLLTSS